MVDISWDRDTGLSKRASNCWSSLLKRMSAVTATTFSRESDGMAWMRRASAAHRRHPQVGEDNVHRGGAHNPEGLLAGRGLDHRDPPGLEHRLEEPDVDGRIIDQQHMRDALKRGKPVVIAAAAMPVFTPSFM